MPSTPPRRVAILEVRRVFPVPEEDTGRKAKRSERKAFFPLAKGRPTGLAPSDQAEVLLVSWPLRSSDPLPP